MKALIRSQNEIVTEAMNMTGINWDTGAPLTNAAWCGGPYILVNDYPGDPDDDFAEDLPAASAESEPEDTVQPSVAPIADAGVSDTVVIDGVVYRRA